IKMICLENISNELFVEICDYLDVYDIYYSFYNLNLRMNQIINSLNVHVNLHYSSKQRFDYCCKFILPYLYNSLVYLTLSNEETIGQILLFTNIFPLENFIRLRSLTLLGIKTNDLHYILPKLSNLNYLSYINVEVEDLLENESICQYLINNQHRSLNICKIKTKHRQLISLENITTCFIIKLTISSINIFNLTLLLKHTPLL
ncbi:unnamed protein product, partial [Didymodactylos carnosus]